MIARSEESKAIQSLGQHPGWPVLLKRFDIEINEGWERFIALPVDKKTSKKAQEHQAAYIVLKRFKEGLVSEAKI